MLAFAVTLSGVSSRTVPVDVTSDGSAQAGEGYTAKNGTVTLQGGESSAVRVVAEVRQRSTRGGVPAVRGPNLPAVLPAVSGSNSRFPTRSGPHELQFMPTHPGVFWSLPEIGVGSGGGRRPDALRDAAMRVPNRRRRGGKHRGRGRGRRARAAGRVRGTGPVLRDVGAARYRLGVSGRAWPAGGPTASCWPSRSTRRGAALRAGTSTTPSLRSYRQTLDDVA